MSMEELIYLINDSTFVHTNSKALLMRLMQWLANIDCEEEGGGTKVKSSAIEILRM